MIFAALVTLQASGLVIGGTTIPWDAVVYIGSGAGAFWNLRTKAEAARREAAGAKTMLESTKRDVEKIALEVARIDERVKFLAQKGGLDVE